MTIRVAVVTNRARHHRYFASRLAGGLDVRCIIHPEGDDRGRGRRTLSRGPVWAGLKAASKAYGRASKRSVDADFASQSEAYFAAADSDYDAIDPSLIHTVGTVNSPEAIDLVKSHDIDLICFLGGDLAKGDFISSAKLACLNLHSGISPFYNGSSSSTWAVAEGRPNFSGITLMHMNERIDGGRVIAHHLPEITAADTAGSLFMKGVQGAIDLYLEAARRLEAGNLPSGVPQQRSFKYTTGMDWTIYQDLKLTSFHASGRMGIYRRPAHTVFYDQPIDGFPYGDLLERILAKGSP